MFLPQLARAERVAFINLAQLLIKADDKITSQEETFINYYIYEAKLEASDIDPQAQLDAQLAKITGILHYGKENCVSRAHGFGAY